MTTENINHLFTTEISIEYVQELFETDLVPRATVTLPLAKDDLGQYTDETTARWFQSYASGYFGGLTGTNDEDTDPHTIN